MEHQSFFGAVLRLWTSNTDAYDPMLARTLQLIPENRSDLEAVARSLTQVRESLRMQLFKCQLENLSRFRINLDNDGSLLRLKDTWPSKLFLNLPNEAAFDLLQKLERQRPKGQFISCSGS